MAFGTKVEAKDILGMEPEEFHSKLGRVDSIADRIAKMEEEQRASNQAILDRLESFKPKETAQPVDAVDPDVAFLANPSRAVNEALDPINRTATDTRIMLEHRNARDRFPGDFDRWGNEIVEVMRKTAPANQMNPDTWEMAVMVVRGKHAGELEKAGAEGKFNYLEPVSAGLRPDPKSADGLDDNQRMMVRKLRNMGPKELTPEKYMNGQKRLERSRNERLGSFGRAS